MKIDAVLYLEKQKKLIQEGRENWTTVEKIEETIEELKKEIEKENENRIYETYCQNENGKFVFIGWVHMLNEDFCIETKRRGNYIYKTYKWLNGRVETLRYGTFVEGC